MSLGFDFRSRHLCAFGFQSILASVGSSPGFPVFLLHPKLVFSLAIKKVELSDAVFKLNNSENRKQNEVTFWGQILVGKGQVLVKKAGTAQAAGANGRVWTGKMFTLPH